MNKNGKIMRCWKAACMVSNVTEGNPIVLLFEVVWNWILYGASDEDFVTMEFYRKNHREKKRWLTSKKNNRYLYRTVYSKDAIDVFNKKDVFVKVYKRFIKHECLVCKDVSLDVVIDFIKKHQEVIVKPSGGACGVGVYKLQSDDNEGVGNLLNELKHGKDLMIEQVIVQHPQMSKMCSSSVNTIRVATMIDRLGEPHVIYTVAKFGGGEGCVSNTLHGGIPCSIDIDTGVINSMGISSTGCRILKHPDSNMVIPGFQIPNWNGVCEYAKSLALHYPSGRYIGWDIVILEDGYDVIEGNIHPGEIDQVCGGKGLWNEIKKYI